MIVILNAAVLFMKIFLGIFPKVEARGGGGVVSRQWVSVVAYGRKVQGTCMRLFPGKHWVFLLERYLCDVAK